MPIITMIASAWAESGLLSDTVMVDRSTGQNTSNTRIDSVTICHNATRLSEGSSEVAAELSRVASITVRP
ncbi:MAG: hypothetical protein ACYTJ0_06335 [Planctomycetota bacterium]